MEKLFIGIKGHVICLDKETGKSIWTTKLKSLSNITNIHFDGSFIFASAKGYLYCLNPEDGSIKWENSLNGLGNGPCIISSEGQTSVITAFDQASQNNAAAAITVTTAAAAAASASDE